MNSLATTSWLDRQLKVLDSTALVALFKTQKLSASGYAELLKQQHLRGGIAIPDQVFFELTEVLPSSLRSTKAQLVQAEAEGRLDEEIEMIARQSPLGGGNRPAEIRGLLHFMAAHPDAIVETRIGRNYSRYCYAQLPDGAITPDSGDFYVLTKGDVQHLRSNDFKQEKLRVHIGDLVQMGYMHRDEYKKRAEKEGSARALKKRFITVGDFLDLAKSGGFINPKTLRAIEERLEKERENLGVKKKDFYLTFGHLEIEINGKQPLLPLRDKPRHNFSEDSVERISVEEMAAPTELMLEHCFYGELIPKGKIEPVARYMGFSVPELGEDREHYRKRLVQEGFFERRVSLQDLQRIGEAFSGDHAFDVIRDLCSDPQKLVDHRYNILTKTTANRASKSYFDREFDPRKGAAYEYAFVDALIHKRISRKEFIDLATCSGALSRYSEYPPAQGTSDGGVWLSTDGKMCYINQKGYKSRTGINALSLRFTDLSRTPEYPNQPDPVIGDVKCYGMVFDELIALAQSRHELAKDAQRMLRAMIYPAIEQDASGFRRVAANILDGGLEPPHSRLMQIEHDWMRHHKNYWGGRDHTGQSNDKKAGQNFPFFTSFFASLYEQRQTAKYNLGELAACELAERLTAENEHVAIVGHDKSILAEPNDNGMPRFNRLSGMIKRYHGEMRQSLQVLEEKLVAASQFGRLSVCDSKSWVSSLKQPLSASPSPIVSEVRAETVGRDVLYI